LLAEQHKMAGAFSATDRRDPVLAKLLPAELARAMQALPIGRMRGGELIVCVRIRRAELIPELERATTGRCSSRSRRPTQLEALVSSGTAVAEGEADVSSRPADCR